MIFYADHLLQLVDDLLARPAPERGGILLGATASPILVEALLDPPDRGSSAVWRMDDDTAAALHEHEQAHPGIRLVGTIHSHPQGLDRPSHQDVVATLDLLLRNPGLGRAHLHIVTRWEDLGPDARASIASHEVALDHGKVSCFQVVARRSGRAVPVSTEVQVMPVLTDATALAAATGMDLSGLSSSLVHGVLHATATLVGDDGRQIRLLAPPGYPVAAPILTETWDGAERTMPLRWDHRVRAADRLVEGLDRAALAAVPAPIASATHAGDDRLTARVEAPLGGSVGGRRVVVFGLGSVGSTIAESLVRTGVDRIALIDPEAVSTANLSRTVYDIHDLGLPKPTALIRHLHAINPAVEVEAVDRPVQAHDVDELMALADGASLVVAATDDPDAQARINALAFRSGVPAVFIGLYARAAAGEVILTVPGSTRCYLCAAPGRAIQSDRASTDYGTGRLTAEPALGCDIARVVAMGARMALGLLALQAGHDTALTRHVLEVLAGGEQFLITSTEPRWGLFDRLLAGVPGQHGFGSTWMSVAGRADCPVCGDHPDDLSRLLSTTDRDALAAAVGALAELDTARPADPGPPTLASDDDDAAAGDELVAPFVTGGGHHT